MDNKARLLSHVPLFARFDARALADLEALVDEVDVAAGTVLMTEGHSGHEFFIITAGEVRVTLAGQVVRTLAAGEFLGEIALIDGGPRTATATATTACSLLVLAHREFDSLLAAHADVRTAVLQALAERVRTLDAHAT